ncbi:amino acid adenylation domain-containing protein [Streptomyces sp. PTM05]|uniref:Amino acid adenylation domain-containing protein n=1 Tax=Streptantibioticus parmotrematis TaxID=2873249 RepID=A0ABS7QS90_9ACTN|nr:amino acid adenylation domain-containing protein [Streptantibioticus parmotrematis]MBY8885255.1 amino acid adenylation domain-containing protein [Streptantibioticus parmotrematis]
MFHLFSRQAVAAADRVAVTDGNQSLTYAALARRVGVLVAAIRETCPTGPVRIGLHLGRTVDLVAAVLAVTAAGHAYVPLDPAYPLPRLRFVAEDSGVSLVVSDRDLPEGLTSAPTVRVDRLDLSATPAPWEPAPADDEAPAYVIHTSGSTGRPKGVEVRRRSVAAMVEAVRARHDFRGDDVWTLFHSYSFDFSVWEMWGALATGATLVVVPSEVAVSPRATVELLVREGVTVMSVVPSVFRYLTAAVRRAPGPPALRRVIFGGESIDVDSIRAWRKAVPGPCEFVNTYGITETTVFVTTRVLTDAELDAGGPAGEFATDLGVPLDGWELRVLDERGTDVARGGTGEIWVAGDGVAKGYVNMPDTTAERFRELPLPGGPARLFYRSGDLATRTASDTYCYAGRADDQVKINGFRIELGEVEAHLRRLPDVADAAVVKGRNRIGDPVLTAYYTSEAELSADDLGRRARTSLPAHMVPTRFVRLPRLPLNPSGKTDRRALAERDTADATTAPDATAAPGAPGATTEPGPHLAARP